MTCTHGANYAEDRRDPTGAVLGWRHCEHAATCSSSSQRQGRIPRRKSSRLLRCTGFVVDVAVIMHRQVQHGVPQISSSTEFHDDFETGFKGGFATEMQHFSDSVQLDAESWLSADFSSPWWSSVVGRHTTATPQHKQHHNNNTQQENTTTTIIQSGEAPFQQARSLHSTLGS